MSVFTAVFSTCLKRTRFLKGQLIVFLVMMIALLEFAVFIGMPTQNSLQVAVIGDIPGLSSGQAFPVTRLERDPGEAAIALGRYDLIIGSDSSGKPLALHARGEALAQTVLSSASLSSPGPSLPQRGMASLVMGYLVIVILEMGVIGALLLMEDREWKLTSRVAAGVPGLGGYLVSHGTFVFAVCFLPAFIIIVAQGAIMGTGLGLSIASWALLLGITSILGAAFAILVAVASPDEDQGATVAQMIIIFSTLLSGSFIASSDQGPALKFFASAMPQKSLMDLCAALECSGSVIRPLIVLGAYIVALILGAILVMRSRLQRGSC
jgi:hypothetical protein